jgi:hypothetical protein
LSPLSQIGAVAGAGNTLLNTLGLGGALTNVGKNLGDWFTKASAEPDVMFKDYGQNNIDSGYVAPNTEAGT